MPEVWKTTHRVPALKKGKDKTNPGSYRSISLLSCGGKLVELVITRRLTCFLETKNVFSPSQTGYHQHRSNEDQLALLTQDLKAASSLFRPVKGVRPGVKKALQWKLLRAGVSCQMYKYISSFLYQRLSSVKLDGPLSREIRLSEGVPQVLSPTLFLLYVNDIVNTLPPGTMASIDQV